MNSNDFTYDFYSCMIKTLKKENYSFCFYDEENNGKTCILRHDIDFDIKKSLDLAKLENELGVKSTYFVLLKTDFYNPISKTSLCMLKKILTLGHEIGLHFDEKSYDENVDVVNAIKIEAEILGKALSHTIKVVSMHRPSKKTLESNYLIDGITNSYSDTFFKNYKYVSDSRRNWREDVLTIIESKMYRNLHILTHAFWYNDHKSDIKIALSNFIIDASKDRRLFLEDNLTNFNDIFEEE